MTLQLTSVLFMIALESELRVMVRMNQQLITVLTALLLPLLKPIVSSKLHQKDFLEILTTTELLILTIIIFGQITLARILPS